MVLAPGDGMRSSGPSARSGPEGGVEGEVGYHNRPCGSSPAIPTARQENENPSFRDRGGGVGQLTLGVVLPQGGANTLAILRRKMPFHKQALQNAMHCLRNTHVRK
jgi:hypothetical protein